MPSNPGYGTELVLWFRAASGRAVTSLATGSTASIMVLMDSDVVFTQLPDLTDERGLSFSVPAETLYELAVRDVHIAAIRSGHVRGNHYHEKKTELITVIYVDEWSFHWDTGPGTSVNSRRFTGSGGVSIAVPLLWSHAVKNDGAKDLWLFNMTDISFDPAQPESTLDAVVRKIV